MTARKLLSDSKWDARRAGWRELLGRVERKLKPSRTSWEGDGPVLGPSDASEGWRRAASDRRSGCRVRRTR